MKFLLKKFGEKPFFLNPELAQNIFYKKMILNCLIGKNNSEILGMFKFKNKK